MPLFTIISRLLSNIPHHENKKLKTVVGFTIIVIFTILSYCFAYTVIVCRMTEYVVVGLKN